MEKITDALHITQQAHHVETTSFRRHKNVQMTSFLTSFVGWADTTDTKFRVVGGGIPAN